MSGTVGPGIELKPGQTVGNDQGCAALHEGAQRLLHFGLAFGVQGARRLVKQQHRRIAQDCAGNRNPLALPAGQGDSALSQTGLGCGNQLLVDIGNG